jgi:hypothetical protein
VNRRQPADCENGGVEQANTRTAARPGTVIALLLPADEQRPCQVVLVPDSAVGFSDAIGGGLLEEMHHDVIAGTHYCVYGDEERQIKPLPPNPRAAVLAARLGWIDRVDRLGLCGDLLIVGAQTPGRDTDVPLDIIAAAIRGDLLRSAQYRAPVGLAAVEKPSDGAGSSAR